jgi:curved DNA-binding protein CbpA
VPRPNNRFYDLLEVSPTVTAEGLDLSYERIYQRLSSERYQAAHPGAVKRLKQVERAYGVLSDPDLRPLYDEFGEKVLEPGFDPGKARRASGGDRWWSPPQRPGPPPAPEAPPPHRDPGAPEPPPAPGAPPQGAAPEPMGSAGGDWKAQAAAASREIPPEERQYREDVRMPDPETPPATTAWVDFRLACLGGRGEMLLDEDLVDVTIPPLVEDGEVIKARGRDLQIRVQSHDVFTRKGLELHLTVLINPKEAEEGTEVIVPKLTGGHMTIRVPPGVKEGGKLRVRGEGVPFGEQVGDMVATIKFGDRPPRVKGFGLNSGTPS